MKRKRSAYAKHEGNGLIPANFRTIPSSARTKALKLFEDLEKIGVSGLLKMGKSGESVLGVPVEEDMKVLKWMKLIEF